MTLHHPVRPELPAGERKSGKPRRAGLITVTVLALLVAAYSARYFTLDPATYLDSQRAVYAAHLGRLLLHVGGGVTALALGPFQFRSRLRARRPAVHRATGRLYVLAALAAGLGGLLLAPISLYPPFSALAFTVLALLTLGFTTKALVEARRGRIDRHRRWMTRSYALIFAAVTFRLWLITFAALGVPESISYPTGAWTSVAINLAVAEWLLRRGRRRSVATAASSGPR